MANDIKSTIMIPELDKEGKKAILQLNTRKHSRGGMYSSVSVMFQDGQFLTFEMFGDFSKTIKTVPAKRVTQKMLEQLHHEVFTGSNISDIKTEALKFYADKALKG